MRVNVGRREFVALLTGATLVRGSPTRAQPSTVPVVGVLRSTTAGGFAHLLPALRQGLQEEGFIEGQNVIIEQHWADNRLDRLPALAAELVKRGVAAIVCNSRSVDAVKAATTTIPIVFVSGDDPVQLGFVNSLNRPGGNITGITFFGGSQLGVKRMELLRDLLPNITVIAVLSDSNFPAFESVLPEIEAAGRALGRRTIMLRIATEPEFGPAFDQMVQAGAGAVLIAGGPFLSSQRRTLAALALRHRLPSSFDIREAVVDGGLMSYSSSFPDAYRQAGGYVGKILKGAKPSELPVRRPTTFELVINLATAKALGIEIPPSIMLRADEMIE